VTVLFVERYRLPRLFVDSVEEHEHMVRHITWAIDRCNTFTGAGNVLVHWPDDPEVRRGVRHPHEDEDKPSYPEVVCWRMGRVFDECYSHGVDVQVTLFDQHGNEHVMNTEPRLLHVMTGGDLSDDPSVWQRRPDGGPNPWNGVPAVGPVSTMLVRSVAVAIRQGLLKRREERHALIRRMQGRQ